MTPLDLTRHPPRSCRAEIDGIPYLARAIDKVRAELPGGDLGQYVVLRPDMGTLSSLFYHKLGIEHDAFAAAVRDASTDADVAGWIRERAGLEQLEGWHRTLFKLRAGRLDPSTRARMEKVHPGAGEITDETLVIDVLDAEDRVTFAPT